jgi:hypothetical protein
MDKGKEVTLEGIKAAVDRIRTDTELLEPGWILVEKIPLVEFINEYANERVAAARAPLEARVREALNEACEACRYSGKNRGLCESVLCPWLKIKDILAAPLESDGK